MKKEKIEENIKEAIKKSYNIAIVKSLLFSRVWNRIYEKLTKKNIPREDIEIFRNVILEIVMELDNNIIVSMDDTKIYKKIIKAFQEKTGVQL